MPSKYFPAPQHWQDFENLTWDVCCTRFPNGGAQMNGRPGQAQDGVDIFYTQPGAGGLTGVQCKKKSPTSTEPASSLTFAEVEAEVKKAGEFRPRLSRFIVATTAGRDRWLQDSINYLSKRHIEKDSFAVEVWFWEDFINFLNMYATVREWYDPLMQAAYGEKRLDREILELLHMAFSRAAFRTPMYSEVPAELRQALQDTQRALDTGILLDRETGITIRSAPSGVLSLQDDDAGKGQQLINCIHSARQLLDQALHDQSIVQEGNCLQVRDRHTAHRIDGERATALRILNELLETNDITPVESPLPPYIESY